MVREFNLSSPTNNTELVASMMEISRHGALAQLFIVDAIHKHAEAVAKATPAQVGIAGGGGRPLISAEAWIAVACEIKGKLDAFYNRHAAALMDEGETPARLVPDQYSGRA